MSDFGKKLRSLREERRLTMKEVAEQAGVSLSTYREWEYGRKILGEPYVKIAEALGVSVGELLSGKKPTKQGVMDELRALEVHLQNLKRELASCL